MAARCSMVLCPLLLFLAYSANAANVPLAPSAVPAIPIHSDLSAGLSGVDEKLKDLESKLPHGKDGLPLKGAALMKEVDLKFLSKIGVTESDLDELKKLKGDHENKAKQELEQAAASAREKHKEAIDKVNETKEKLQVKPHPADAPLSIDQVNNVAGLGEVLHDSDVFVSVQEARKTLGSSGIAKRQAYYDSQYPSTIWTDGVPYHFDDALGQNARNVINQAINFWKSTTCVQFNYVDPQTTTAFPVLIFYAGSGCYSSVGRQSNSQMQYVSIGNYCEYVATAAHEIAHALGLFHEQSRLDRDDHIWVDTSNIQAGHSGDYQKQNASTNYNYGMPYDYQGIMHHRQGVWAQNASLPVMFTLDPNYQLSMGWSQLPVFGDVVEVNMHYSCYEKCTNFTTTCFYGGYPSVKNCSLCQCPSGFGGINCNNRQGPSGGANCGATLAANPDWQTLSINKTIGNGNYSTGNLINPAKCTWHITAPRGSKIQYTVNFVGFDGDKNALCYEDCYYGGLGIKGSGTSWKPEGMRVCCPYQYGVNFTTTANLLVIQPWNLYRYTDFQVQYKIANAAVMTS
uniref:Zinc metalloproteinase n=1 Tax=Steinernema glaseri TaxID=37863 RepID=A0A1I8AIB8_9BILA